MKRVLLFLLCATSVSLFANEIEYLWPKDKMPNRQAHQIAALTSEKEKGTEPYLEWYDMPTNAPKTDACVILISGGGYYCQCDVGLVKDKWPKALHEAGVRCVNLVHRTPRPKGLPFYQSAWEDAQRAVRIVRSRAAKYGFDPEKIGIMGMSAGSHVATLLATSALTPAYEPIDDLDKSVPCHVNWATTFAIAYALTDGLGTSNKTGGDAPDVKLDSIFKFDEKTAPMCMMHGGKDVFSPLSSTFVYRKLREKKIPAEVHLYPDKPHGMFGLDRAIEFMRQMGFLGKVGPQIEVMKRFPKDTARASVERKDVWEKGQMPDVQTNQCMPYYEWHMPKELKTKAIQIIWSGGAYVWDDPECFEAASARRYLNEKGMTVVSVKYRYPRPAAPLAKHISAWQDVQRVIRLVRNEASSRGLDPDRIGVMGSSAGGHLSLMAALSSSVPAYAPVDDVDNTSCAVQWAVNIYPAYVLTDGADSENKNGGNPDDAVIMPEFKFDDATPPMLFIHGDADGYASMNSVKMWEKLRRMGIQCELHTLALRKHCFQQKASEGTGSYTWLDRIWEFLTQKGFVRDAYGKRIVFLGDSITDKRHIGCTKNYWGFLGERYGFEPLVYGINGQQMSHITAQANKFKSEHPEGADVIFVFAGTNDFNDNTPLGEWYSFSDEMTNKNGKQMKLRKRSLLFDGKTFRGRINLAMSHLKENFPNARIVMLTPIHRGYATFSSTNVQPDESYANTIGLFLDDYVAAIKEAGNVWSVKVVDLHATSGIFPNSRAHDSFISNAERDRLHPSDAGHERMAGAIALEVGAWLK